MTRLTGYAKKDEPKWFYALVLLLVLVVVLAGLFGFSAFYRWLERQVESAGQPKPTTTTTTPASASPETAAVSRSGITVEKIVFTSAIDEANQPTDDLLALSPGEVGTLYCYTRISSQQLPQVISHVWVDPGGAEVAEIKLTLTKRQADTYSYISLYGAKSGSWELQVKDASGGMIGRKSFIVKP